MKSQRFLVTLTLVNFIILLVVLLLFSTAFKPDVVPVLRGHAFELVDDGSGLVLGSESGYIQILSRSAEPILRLKNNDGKERIIKIE